MVVENDSEKSLLFAVYLTPKGLLVIKDKRLVLNPEAKEFILDKLRDSPNPGSVLN